MELADIEREIDRAVARFRETVTCEFAPPVKRATKRARGKRT